MTARNESAPSKRELLYAARNGLSFTADNMWPCLEIGHWAPEDVDGHLQDVIAMLDKVIGGEDG